MITSSTKKAVLNQTCAGQVEAVAGSGFGTGRKFLVRLPADMPAGVAYLESQQGPFVGGACPALVMPAELAAAAGELLHALRARDAMLQCSSSGGRSMAPIASSWATYSIELVSSVEVQSLLSLPQQFQLEKREW